MLLNTPLFLKKFSSWLPWTLSLFFIRSLTFPWISYLDPDALLTWFQFLLTRLVPPKFQNHFGLVCYNNGTCWITPFSDALMCLCNVTLLLHHSLEFCWPCVLLRQVKCGRCDIAQNLRRHCSFHSCLLACNEAGVKDVKPHGSDKTVQVPRSLTKANLLLPLQPDCQPEATCSYLSESRWDKGKNCLANLQNYEK